MSAAKPSCSASQEHLPLIKPVKALLKEAKIELLSEQKEAFHSIKTKFVLVSFQVCFDRN